jgi:hypothetical protein
MCNACGFYCCALDTFDGCGCDGCPCEECWSADPDEDDDFDYDYDIPEEEHRAKHNDLLRALTSAEGNKAP